MKLCDLLKDLDNDYSKEETSFFNSTGLELLGTESFNVVSAPSISVVIPAYKAHKTLPLVLRALNQQVYLAMGGELEVIVIDDDSPIPALDISNLPILSFRLRYIKQERNSGAGAARDRGISEAKGDIIVFIDADVLLPKNFLSNHAFAHTHLNAQNIMISFRKNIDFRLAENMTEFISPTENLNDHRVHMIFKKEWVMRPNEESLVGKEFSLLNQTNLFKDFGHLRQIELWTLPMMVLTCAMSVSREAAMKAIPSPVGLRGWGFNDTCMAAKMMAYTKAKVVPLLNSNVLHIIEENHTKLDYVKNEEYLENEKVYNSLLQEEI